MGISFGLQGFQWSFDTGTTQHRTKGFHPAATQKGVPGGVNRAGFARG
jgi:hypothetical protein